MRYAHQVLALLVLIALTGVARAETTGEKTLSGKITKVSAKSFVMVDDAKKTHTVRTDANTKIMLDGKEAKLSELKAGQTVQVTTLKGVAETVEATSAADAGSGSGK